MVANLDTYMHDEDAFKKDLAEAINKHSRERFSDTPDFVLAQLLYDTLRAYEQAVRLNKDWHDEKGGTLDV